LPLQAVDFSMVWRFRYAETMHVYHRIFGGTALQTFQQQVHLRTIVVLHLAVALLKQVLPSHRIPFPSGENL
jgi:hypothetical protein